MCLDPQQSVANSSEKLTGKRPFKPLFLVETDSYALHPGSNVSESNPMAASLVITHGILMIAPAELYKGANDSLKNVFLQFSSVAQLCLTLCKTMDCSTSGLPVHHQLPEFIQTQCPLSRWCHPTISSSVVSFSFCLPSFPASGSFQMSQFFASGGQSIGVSTSASDLLMNTLGKWMFLKPLEKPGERWGRWSLGSNGVDHS